MSDYIDRAAKVIADFNACGHCEGTCGTCRGEAEALAGAGLLATPEHDAEVAAKALRAAVVQNAITIPDVLGYKVRAVAVEDLLGFADRIERAHRDGLHVDVDFI